MPHCYALAYSYLFFGNFAENYDTNADGIPESRFYFSWSGHGFVESVVTKSSYDPAAKKAHFSGKGILNHQAPVIVDVDIERHTDGTGWMIFKSFGINPDGSRGVQLFSLPKPILCTYLDIAFQ